MLDELPGELPATADRPAGHGRWPLRGATWPASRASSTTTCRGVLRRARRRVHAARASTATSWSPTEAEADALPGRARGRRRLRRPRARASRPTRRRSRGRRLGLRTAATDVRRRSSSRRRGRRRRAGRGERAGRDRVRARTSSSSIERTRRRPSTRCGREVRAARSASAGRRAFGEPGSARRIDDAEVDVDPRYGTWDATDVRRINRRRPSTGRRHRRRRRRGAPSERRRDAAGRRRRARPRRARPGHRRRRVRPSTGSRSPRSCARPATRRPAVGRGRRATRSTTSTTSRAVVRRRLPARSSTRSSRRPPEQPARCSTPCPGSPAVAERTSTCCVADGAGRRRGRAGAVVPRPGVGPARRRPARGRRPPRRRPPVRGGGRRRAGPAARRPLRQPATCCPTSSWPSSSTRRRRRSSCCSGSGCPTRRSSRSPGPTSTGPSSPTTSRRCGSRAGARRWRPRSRGSPSWCARCASECPWDREQTHADAHPPPARGDLRGARGHRARSTPRPATGYDHLEEELGDLLFQVVFHATLAAEAGAFTLADVARGIHDKLVAPPPARVRRRRRADGRRGDDATGRQIKQAEKGRGSRCFDGIPGDAAVAALRPQGPAQGRHARRRGRRADAPEPDDIGAALFALVAAARPGRSRPRGGAPRRRRPFPRRLSSPTSPLGPDLQRRFRRWICALY